MRPGSPPYKPHTSSFSLPVLYLPLPSGSPAHPTPSLYSLTLMWNPLTAWPPTLPGPASDGDEQRQIWVEPGACYQESLRPGIDVGEGL